MTRLLSCIGTYRGWTEVETDVGFEVVKIVLVVDLLDDVVETVVVFSVVATDLVIEVVDEVVDLGVADFPISEVLFDVVVDVAFAMVDVLVDLGVDV